jgi:hypothetical protein
VIGINRLVTIASGTLVSNFTALIVLMPDAEIEAGRSMPTR